MDGIGRRWRVDAHLSNGKGRPLDANGRPWTAKWWSWRELNPHPQAFSAQIYMFSVLI
jgi:hypothetical protein